ncbi:Putative uncharacterized protein [Moritella viscosa]|uniref:Uncharacterized protein n=1 Tax=Moritella viscosa TaxID=80854 RepID=A0A090I8E0_9GAMM|nr:DUF3630 family protein [Moritella viscosa]CED58110.1 putative uncharacterized protein [Moritella viscosa]SGZ05066.1 Putative uncharacterized protein [Moritella viscosa]SHO08497.1 Putative uncharacterized protein [Moritella viscosa]SHO08533.1 Putative uncharacterized protein [Moritella viscosa]SHO09511.1 Putative uncharacterized protein [Moritella viscosa]
MNWTLAAQQATDNILMLEHDAVSFENFTTLAPKLVTLLDARVCDKNWGADRHAWMLEYKDINLLFEFEDYTCSAWLAVTREEDQGIFAEIAKKLV